MTVSKTRLPNGLLIATDRMEGVETTSIGAWIDVGARNETVELNGISHMLEHMAFKGTKLRTARAIAEEIEAVGGHLNAYTSREQTAYFARVVSGDLGLAVDILSDILQNSIFEAHELERESSVIIQEIGQVQDTPDDLIFDQLQETAFPDQPLGRSILGTIESVKTFDNVTLKSYMDRSYAASNMALIASGNVNHEQFVSLVQKGFGDLRVGNESQIEPGDYCGGDWRENRDLEQVHLLIGFQGLPFEDDDFYAAQILSTILGGGMSSRLFQEIREERGLSYSIFSFLSSYTDCGLFGVYAGTGESQITELMPVICDQLNLMKESVTNEELSRAKTQHKAGMKMALESSMSRCEQLGRQILIYGRPIPMNEIIHKIEAVEIESISRVANRILSSGPPTVAAIGPISKLEGYSVISGRFG